MEEDNMGMPGRKPLNFRKDVIPSMNRRMRCHDYSQPGYYMITDSICDYIPRLSKVVGKPFKPVGYVGNGSGQVPMLPAGPIPGYSAIPEFDGNLAPRTELSDTGRILSEQINCLPERFPVEVKNFVIMPDHYHLLLNVKEVFPKKLGAIISSLKGRCSRVYWDSYPDTECSRMKLPFFTKNYNDRPLFGKGQLGRMVNYINENPRRYLIRKTMPDYFYRRWEMEFEGERYHLIGNVFLLQYHSRVAVRYSRRYSDSFLREHISDCKESARRGDVIVSTFIHNIERSVSKECMDLGAKLIWLKTNGFPERSAVKGRAHDLCAEGRLLMVAPEKYYTSEPELKRSFCEKLNRLAAFIATEDISKHLRLIR